MSPLHSILFPNRPIPAFCSSDEEDEDPDSLLYLPIAPEIEVQYMYNFINKLMYRFVFNL